MRKNSYKKAFIAEHGIGMWDLVDQYWHGDRSPEATNASRLYNHHQQGLKGDTWTIYTITEFGRVVYIGLTGTNPAQRWSVHKSKARNLNGACPLHRAMNEVSSDHAHFPAYRFSILHQTKDKSAAEALEIAEIAAHETQKDGYNIYMGGGNNGKKFGKDNP